MIAKINSMFSRTLREGGSARGPNRRATATSVQRRRCVRKITRHPSSHPGWLLGHYWRCCASLVIRRARLRDVFCMLQRARAARAQLAPKRRKSRAPASVATDRACGIGQPDPAALQPQPQRSFGSGSNAASPARAPKLDAGGLTLALADFHNSAMRGFGWYQRLTCLAAGMATAAAIRASHRLTLGVARL